MTTHTVEIERDGETTTIEVAEDEYILDAAEDAGLDLPYSCRDGACTSCVGRIEAGAVERNGVALDQDQKEDGYVLLCCASPRSDCEFVADVQEELFAIDI